jgi:hypothetical protein
MKFFMMFLELEFCFISASSFLILNCQISHKMNLVEKVINDASKHTTKKA